MFRYTKNFSVGDVSFDLGSDWHLPAGNIETVDLCLADLKSNQQSDWLVLAGDLFDTEDGEDVSSEIVQLFSKIRNYKSVWYLPGNHDLRGRKDPWFSLRGLDDLGVIYPKLYGPEIIQHQGLQVMIGNLFYDFQFIDSRILNIIPEEVMKFYREETPDGEHFLGGSTELFPIFSKIFRDHLSDQVDLVMTHAVPHPSLVTFKVAEMTHEHQEMSTKLGVPFFCDPAGDERDACRYKQTPERSRRYWNFKSLIMGSNIFQYPNFDTKNPPKFSSFRGGLTSVFGHNHRSTDQILQINDKSVRFISHQPCPWKDHYRPGST